MTENSVTFSDRIASALSKNLLTKVLGERQHRRIREHEQESLRVSESDLL